MHRRRHQRRDVNLLSKRFLAALTHYLGIWEKSSPFFPLLTHTHAVCMCFPTGTISRRHAALEWLTRLYCCNRLLHTHSAVCPHTSALWWHKYWIVFFWQCRNHYVLKTTFVRLLKHSPNMFGRCLSRLCFLGSVFEREREKREAVFFIYLFPWWFGRFVQLFFIIFFDTYVCMRTQNFLSWFAKVFTAFTFTHTAF